MPLLDEVPTLQPPTYTPPTYTPQQATAQQATSTGYTPESFAVTPQQTVQGQLPGIIDTNSPLMRQAATRAKQEMNARGLLNSSIAIGAGHEAVIGAALPIAQNDAGVYERAGTNTVNAKNAALNFTAAAGNQASLANAQLGTGVSQSNAEAANKAFSERYQAQQQGSLANLDAATRAYTANLDSETRILLGNLDADTRLSLGQLDAQTRLSLGQLDADTKTNLANIDGQYRQLLQTNQSAATLMQQHLTNITNISNNDKLSEAAKEAAITTQIESLKNSLATLSEVASTSPSGLGNLNISSLWSDYSVDGTPRSDSSGGGEFPTAPGAQVYAFGQNLTIGPSVAPNTAQDHTRYNEAQANDYPYWIGSDGYAYPARLAPGSWPENLFAVAPRPEGAPPEGAPQQGPTSPAGGIPYDYYVNPYTGVGEKMNPVTGIYHVWGQGYSYNAMPPYYASEQEALNALNAVWGG